MIIASPSQFIKIENMPSEIKEKIISLISKFVEALVAFFGNQHRRVETLIVTLGDLDDAFEELFKFINKDLEVSTQLSQNFSKIKKLIEELHKKFLKMTGNDIVNGSKTWIEGLANIVHGIFQLMDYLKVEKDQILGNFSSNMLYHF